MGLQRHDDNFHPANKDESVAVAIVGDLNGIW